MYNSSIPKALLNSNEGVFFQMPPKVIIDEDAKTTYSTSSKIETLIQELKEKGPLVAHGSIGPQNYTAEPKKLSEKIDNTPIFGMSKENRSTLTVNTYAIVLGARKIQSNEYVYYRLSEDNTLDTKSYVREHRSTMDSRVFITRHQTFLENLTDIYPPVKKEKTHPNFVSAGSLQCTAAEMEYVAKLTSIMPLESILKENEVACKEIGQQVFDIAKANGATSIAAKESAQRVCDAIKSCAKDGALRAKYVEYAWDGIGDNNWRWQH